MVFRKRMAIEMKKIKVKMNKPVYLGLPILEISIIFMYEFWYDYMKPKHQSNAKLCYMHKDITDDIEKRFDTSNYKVNHYLQ